MDSKTVLVVIGILLMVQLAPLLGTIRVVFEYKASQLFRGPFILLVFLCLITPFPFNLILYILMSEKLKIKSQKGLKEFSNCILQSINDLKNQ